MKKLLVVICNYNKKDYLRECVKSVFKSKVPGVDFQVLVVDNASTDGSVQMLKNEFEDSVIRLENEDNLGGSGGFARGIDYFLEHDYEYIVLLDNDTRIEPVTIANLLQHIEENPGTGVVGAKILQMDNPGFLQELGAYIDWETFNIRTPFKGQKDSDKLPQVVDCDYVAACCCLSTRAVIKKSGNFDVRHFIYWDDMDWCTRVKRSGFKVQAISSAVVYHKMGANNIVNTFNNYYFTKNRIVFFLKHLADNRIKQFAKALTEHFNKLMFFSTHKGQVNNALSQLLALEDLQNRRFGRVDEHILDKENVHPLEHIGLSAKNNVLLVSNKSLETSNTVFNFLDRYFNRLTVTGSEVAPCVTGQYVFKNMADVHEDDYDYIFYVCTHILDAETECKNRHNVLLIDGYRNIEFADQIKELKASFLNFNKIQNSLFYPVVLEKLKIIKAEVNNVFSEQI